MYEKVSGLQRLLERRVGLHIDLLLENVPKWCKSQKSESESTRGVAGFSLSRWWSLAPAKYSESLLINHFFIKLNYCYLFVTVWLFWRINKFMQCILSIVHCKIWLQNNQILKRYSTLLLMFSIKIDYLRIIFFR